MILVGEPHPELQLDSLIRSLDLGAQVRVLGFRPIEEFVGYLAACDIVLNLRYPTVGENSGTLMRALGLGKAVIVSEVGSFSELPDSICLKTPVDASEEDHLFEYLNLLVSRPEMRRELGASAREWVETECTWPKVAERYAEFLECVAGKRQVTAAVLGAGTATRSSERALWSRNTFFPGRRTNRPRATSKRILRASRRRWPSRLLAGPDDRILEMGSYLQITPALQTRLGYGEVRGCYYGPAGRVEHRSQTSANGEQFTCDIELFNAEKDRFPYADEYFSTVLCCELVEHLTEDPMHMMAEINRILRPGGHLVLTTPNIGSLRAIAAILAGYHPGFFPAYIRPRAEGEEPEARHNREYTPREIVLLVSLRRLRNGAARNRAVPGRTQAGARVGEAFVAALRTAARSARRRHLRRGTQVRYRARALSRTGSINDTRRIQRRPGECARLVVGSAREGGEQVARNLETRDLLTGLAVLRSGNEPVHPGR